MYFLMATSASAPASAFGGVHDVYDLNVELDWHSRQGVIEVECDVIVIDGQDSNDHAVAGLVSYPEKHSFLEIFAVAGQLVFADFSDCFRVSWSEAFVRTDLKLFIISRFHSGRSA